jgi:alpha-1,6-mannosyltransferase
VYALVLLAPPLLSTDVFSYQFYGRMVALYGANPYTAGPHALALDPLYPYIGSKWAYIPTAYGPLFTELSYLLAPLSIAANVFAYKAIAACAGLATVALVWHAARLRGLDPVRPVVLVGLNPLVVVYAIGGGHNDLLMLLGVVAGIYLVLRGKERSGGAMMVLGAAVKLTAVLPLAFAIASGGGSRARNRRREVAVGAGVTAAVIGVLSFSWFGTGPLNLPATLAQSQSEGDWHSIPGFISTRLGLGGLGEVTGIFLFAVFVVVFCWLLRRVWRGQLDWIDAAAWTAAVLLLTASSLLPWYVAWLIPLAALAADPRLTRVAVIGSGVVLAIQMVGYLPHGSSLFGI